MKTAGRIPCPTVEEVALFAPTADALKACIKRRTPLDAEEAQVILNAKGEPITRFGIRYITRKYGMNASETAPRLKMKPLTPHRIARHA